MAKASGGKRQASGELTYLHEKLGQAIGAALFADNPREIASVFEILSRGVEDVRTKGEDLPFLRDANARHWFDEIKRLIAPSSADASAPRANEVGTYQIRAERMTKDEKRELASCMQDLYAHIGLYGRS